MSEEINGQLKNVKVENIQKKVEEALAKVDFEELTRKLKDGRTPKEEIKKLKKDMEQLKINLRKEKFDLNIDKEKITKEVHEGMKNAKEGMRKAHEEMKKAQGDIVKAKTKIAETKAFINKLAGDGLIDTLCSGNKCNTRV